LPAAQKQGEAQQQGKNLISNEKKSRYFRWQKCTSSNS
jgi:hypothetical protein